ncbi:MAG: phage tail tape measure protein [Defluviitaleaceae bacterium]|nr:phage tail tape measure protein [Defluviitaleaceae bacterium]MCL2263952.1 phage tail tape measure protein [Defluviitaleaceae bacterium]
MAKKGFRRTITIDFDTSQVDRGEKNVKSAMRALNSEFEKNATEIRKNGKASQEVALQKEVLTKKIEVQSKRVAELQKTYDDKKDSLGAYAKETMNAKNELNKAEQSLGKLKNQLASTDNALERQKGILGGIITGFDDFSASAKRAGVDIDAVATGLLATGAVLTGVGVTAGKMALNFDDEMVRVRMAAAAAGESIDNIEPKILSVSNRFNISAGEIASAAANMISAGQGANTLGVALSNAAGLARHGNISMAESQKLVTQAALLFNMSLEEQTVFVDKVAKATALGNISVRDITGSLERISPTLRYAGIEAGEYVAALSALTAAGIPAQEAQRMLRFVLEEMIKPSNDAKEAADELGIAWGRQLLQSHGLTGSIIHLANSSGQLGAEYEKLFRRANAGIGFGILMQEADVFRKHVDALSDSTGFINGQLEILQESSGERLRSSINSLKNTMIEGGGAFDDVANRLAGFIEMVAGIHPETITAISIVGGFALTLGGLVKTIEGLKRVQQSYLIVKGLVLKATGAQTVAENIAAIGSGKLSAARAKQLLMSGTLQKAYAAEAVKRKLLTAADLNAAKAAGVLSQSRMIAIGKAGGLTVKNTALAKSNTLLSSTNLKLAASSKAAAVGGKSLGFASMMMAPKLMIVAAAAIAVAVAIAAIAGRARSASDEIKKATQSSQQGAFAMQRQVNNLPRYATGTMHHRGGRAWVGDGGGPEIVELPVGTKVHSANHSQLLTGQDRENAQAQNIYNFSEGSIVIDAKSVKDMADVIELVKSITQSRVAVMGV